MEIVINTLKEKLVEVKNQLNTMEITLNEGFTDYLQTTEVNSILNEYYTRFTLSGEYNVNNWKYQISISHKGYSMWFGQYKNDEPSVWFYDSITPFKVDMDLDLKENKENLFNYYSLLSQKEELTEILNKFGNFIIREYTLDYTILKGGKIMLENDINRIINDEKNEQINKWMSGDEECDVKPSLETHATYKDGYETDSVYFNESHKKWFSAKYKKSTDKGHREHNLLNIHTINQIDKNRYEVEVGLYRNMEKVTFTKDNLINTLSEIYNWNKNGWKKDWDEIIGRTFDFWSQNMDKCELNHTNVEMYKKYDYDTYKDKE